MQAWLQTLPNANGLREQTRALDRRLRTVMMVCVSKPTLTAAYSECGVSTYSCTHSGRHTGSAIAIRKSYAWRYTGENVSKNMRPSGHTHSGLHAEHGLTTRPKAVQTTNNQFMMQLHAQAHLMHRLHV